MNKIIYRLYKLFEGKIAIIVALCLFTLLILSSGLKYDLNEWDESRLGSNCYEMHLNHDYINLYYNGKPDTWIAKPVFLNWLILISANLLGFNELSLRLPTYLATVALIYFLMRLIQQYESTKTALITSLVLLTSKTLLGWHSGLTGDYDMTLTLFLTLSISSFLQYMEIKNPKQLYIFAVFTGLAFYTKGTAAFIFIPGIIAYLIIKRKFISVIKTREFLIASLILLAFVLSWVLLLLIFGNHFDSSFYGSNNAISTLFFDDTFRRITDNSFQDKTGNNPFFVFVAMDVRLNLWNYIFYIILFALTVRLLINTKSKTYEASSTTSKLIELSFCITIPVFLLLSFSKTQHDWYLIPCFVFIAYIIAHYIVVASVTYKPVLIGFTLLTCITLSRHAYYIYSQPTIIHKTLNRNNPVLKNAKRIVSVGMPKHHIFLYLQWMKMKVVNLPNANALSAQKGELLLLCNDQLKDIPLQHISIMQRFDEFVIARIN